jgi:hypothetical protein
LKRKESVRKRVCAVCLSRTRYVETGSLGQMLLFVVLSKKSWYYVVGCGPATISKRISCKRTASYSVEQRGSCTIAKEVLAAKMVLMAPGLSRMSSVWEVEETKNKKRYKENTIHGSET